MKRSILFFVMWAMVFAVAVAQRYQVTGCVVDSKTGEPVGMAAVQLLKGDSTVVSGVSTDAWGNFKLTPKQKGRYDVKISFISYRPIVRTAVLDEKTDSVGLGRLEIESMDQSLHSAIVTGTAARVEQKEDTTVFNASAYRVPEGSTLEALVKQLPGVEVSDDGKIKVHGKEVKEFLINGKDFFKGDTETAMKNLPTNLVNRIKAYDKQSDYAEMTGIDDGEESAVLDIMTKRELNQSLVSNVDLGYGTENRYTGRVFVTHFTDKSRVTVYGQANNVGNQGFGGPRGFGGGNGLTATKEAGLDFTWENGKKKREPGRFEVGGMVRYRHTTNDLLSTSASETFLNTGSTSSFSNSRNKSYSSSTSLNTNLRFQWSPDSMTNITFRPSFSHSDGRNQGNSQTATFNDDPYDIEGMDNPLDSIFVDPINSDLKKIAVNSNNRLSKGDNKSNRVNGVFNIVRRIGNGGRNVSFRATANYSQSENNSYSISNISYFNGKEPSFLNQYSTTPSKDWNYNLRVGYVEPITKTLFAEVRYEYSFKYTDSDRSRYNLDKIDAAIGSWADPNNFPPIGTLPTDADVLAAVRDLNNSQYATYKYYDHMVNVGLRYNTEKIRFNAGVDFNPEETKMAYERPGQNIDTLITRKVFNISPQIRFRYRFSKTDNLDIRYRGSASQPSMTNLLAVVDNSDPLNISMGNPGLKPSWTNSFNANYRGYNADYQRTLAGGLSYSQTRNSISNLMVYDEATGVRYTRPENISGNWNANGHFVYNAGFGPEKTFTLSSFTRLNYNNQVGYVSSFDGKNSNFNTAPLVRATAVNSYDVIFKAASPQKSTTRTTGVNENLDATYRGSWGDVGLLGSLGYQHSRSTLQDNANMDTWNFAYGARANIYLSWGMSISTDIRMNSRRGYAEESMNTDELLWNAQITQSFLKNKAATLSLQFYDILQQQSNVSRMVNSMMRSDSWNNAINAYCMVHFIYKLNIFGGTKNDSKATQERRPGMPPGGGFPQGGMPRMMGRPM